MIRLALQPLEPRLVPAVLATADAGGHLSVVCTAGDAVSVTASAGLVRVNGADPSTGPLAASALTALTVTGSVGDDSIDLSDLLPSLFPSLASVSLAGGGGRDALIGPAVDKRWLVTGVDAGQIDGAALAAFGPLLFDGFADLRGGAGDDAFAFADGAGLSGVILGAGGVDSLDLSDFSTPVGVSLTAADADGFAGTAPVVSSFGGIDALAGGTAADTLAGLDADAVWTLADGGTYAALGRSLTFAGFEALTGGSAADVFVLTGGPAGTVTADLTGGSGDDTFDFRDGVVLTGVADGGTGTDTITWVAYGSAVLPVVAGTDADGSFGTEPTSIDGSFRGIDAFLGTTVPDPDPGPTPAPGPPASAPTPPGVPAPAAVPLARTPAYAVGAGAGGLPLVRGYAADGTMLFEVMAFDPGFRGGVRVATADVTGDGVTDLIVAAGPGGGPHVKVFDGRTGAVVRSFWAFGPAFAGGVNLAAADLDGDGRAEIVCGADAGALPHIRVFDGRTGAEAWSFLAFDPGFRGGVRVAASDLTGDGRADLIAAAGPGGGPEVTVYDGATWSPLGSFWADNPAFAGGVYIAAGDGLLATATGVAVRARRGGDLALIAEAKVADLGGPGGVRVGVAGGRVLLGSAPGRPGVVRSYQDGVAEDRPAFDPAFLGGVWLD